MHPTPPAFRWAGRAAHTVAPATKPTAQRNLKPPGGGKPIQSSPEASHAPGRRRRVDATSVRR